MNGRCRCLRFRTKTVSVRHSHAIEIWKSRAGHSRGRGRCLSLRQHGELEADNKDCVIARSEAYREKPEDPQKYVQQVCTTRTNFHLIAYDEGRAGVGLPDNLTILA